MTAAQTKALDTLWPRYGLNLPMDTPLDLEEVFGRSAPRTLEIGFGNGEALSLLAGQHPERDFLGVEVHGPGVGQLLHRVGAKGLDNVRVFRGDALQVLETALAPACLDEVLLWFPDPWPKTRHHKRRIVDTRLLDLVHSRLRAGGHFHLATDWQEYAEWMLEKLSARPDFRNDVAQGGFLPPPAPRPQTKFERRGLGLGHQVWDLRFHTLDAADL